MWMNAQHSGVASIIFQTPFLDLQVELDPAFGGALIFAPMDVSKVIRPEMPSTFSLPEEPLSLGVQDARISCRDLDGFGALSLVARMAEMQRR